MVSITDLQRLRNTSLCVRMIKTIKFTEERWWIDSKGMVASWTFNRKDEKFWLNHLTWRPICSVFRFLSKNDATDFNLPESNNRLLKTASTQFNNLVKWNIARNCVSKNTLITFRSRLLFYDFPLVFTKTRLKWRNSMIAIGEITVSLIMPPKVRN